MINFKFASKFLVTLGLASSLAGCVFGSAGSPIAYPGYDIAHTGSIERCSVLRILSVVIESRANAGTGTAVGVAVGVLLGSRVSARRHGLSVAELALGVAAGAIGEGIAVAASRRDGFEIVVQTLDGRVFDVVQPAGEAFVPGEQVYLASSYSGLRVTH